MTEALRLFFGQSPPHRENSNNQALSQLPQEVLASIFSHTNLVTLSTCCQVSKFYNIFIENLDDIWKTFLSGIPHLPLPKRNIRNFLCTNCILSSNNIEKILMRFLKSVPQGKQGTVEFIFIHHPNSKMAVSSSYGKGTAFNKVFEAKEIMEKKYWVLELLNGGSFISLLRFGPRSNHIPFWTENKHMTIFITGMLRAAAPDLGAKSERALKNYACQLDVAYRANTVYYANAAAVAGLAIITQFFWG